MTTPAERVAVVETPRTGRVAGSIVVTLDGAPVLTIAGCSAWDRCEASAFARGLAVGLRTVAEPVVVRGIEYESAAEAARAEEEHD